MKKLILGAMLLGIIISKSAVAQQAVGNFDICINVRNPALLGRTIQVTPIFAGSPAQGGTAGRCVNSVGSLTPSDPETVLWTIQIGGNKGIYCAGNPQIAIAGNTNCGVGSPNLNNRWFARYNIQGETATWDSQVVAGNYFGSGSGSNSLSFLTNGGVNIPGMNMCTNRSHCGLYLMPTPYNSPTVAYLVDSSNRIAPASLLKTKNPLIHAPISHIKKTNAKGQKKSL